MKFIKNYLPETEYYKKEFKKEQIYLHHTVSSTAASSSNWWKQDGLHIATAYLIERDGTIIENFDPKYWSFHLGLKGTKGKIDKKSIGIEIVNEGWLEKKGEEFFWFGGKAKYKGEVVKIDTPWRDQKYFAKYPDEQIHSVAVLVNLLLKNLKIEYNIINNLDYNKDLINSHVGVLSHCNVRSDKTDVSPAFPITTFKDMVLNLDSNLRYPEGLELVGV